jgi:Uma2 family endonuclease
MSTASLPTLAPVWGNTLPVSRYAEHTSQDKPQNAAEVWLRAGQVPLDRILMIPAPGTATRDDAVHSKARFGEPCELVDGILVAKTLGYYESVVGAAIAYFLHLYTETNPTGAVAGADGGYDTLPDRLRKPDASFTSYERIRSQPKPTRDALPFAPDLAVEILSPSNTAAEMDQKLKEYFAAGARLVWYIEPELKTARTFTAVGQWEDIPPGGSLLGRDVLPGFALPLTRLFEKAGPNPATPANS